MLFGSDSSYGLLPCIHPFECFGRVRAAGLGYLLQVVDGHLAAGELMVESARVQAGPVGQLAHGQSGLVLHEGLQSQADGQRPDGFVGVPVAAVEPFAFQVAHGADDSFAACQTFAGGLLVTGDGLPAQGD